MFLLVPFSEARREVKMRNLTTIALVLFVGSSAFAGQSAVQEEDSSAVLASIRTICATGLAGDGALIFSEGSAR